MKSLQKISNVINVVFILTLLLSCDGNDVTKGKDTETPQGLSSLVGTEWVHSDDTDPESQNWFNLCHSPFHFNTGFGKYDNTFEFESPSVIKFLENGIIYEPTYKYYWHTYYADKDYMRQYYRYSYNEPYITIIMYVASLPQWGMHPSDFQMESVEETKKKWNLCPLTIDEPQCDSSKCKNSAPNGYCSCSYYLLYKYSYFFLGKVEGDTMHLQQFVPTDPLDNYKNTIIRDIYLVRRK